MRNVLLTPCEFLEGFFKVPGFPFSANEEGLVYSYHLGLIPPAFFDQKKKEENKYIHIDKQLAHRLVGLTFLELPEGKAFDEVLINHKNGLKYDNRVDNLEWTDYSGNSIHAYSTGLRDDNRYVKTFDTLTGKVEEFYSLWDCARNFGVNGGRIHGYLNRQYRDVLFLERYLLIDSGEPFPKEEIWRNWDLSITDQDYIALNTRMNQLSIYSRRRLAFNSAGITYTKERKLLLEAKLRGENVVTVGDWKLVAFSRRQFLAEAAETIDNRLSREDRYRNYRPRNTKRPLSQ